MPSGVRVETVSVVEQRPQIIGGTLKTLLYTTQLAAISQDPWFSRVQSPEIADYVAIDLDPGRRRAVRARARRRAVGPRRARGARRGRRAQDVGRRRVCTSISRCPPVRRTTPDCSSARSSRPSSRRSIRRSRPSSAACRARGARVYVDYLQNILGKTLATAYSARASEYAGVSTPLTWDEIDAGIRREDFTIATMGARLKQVGDLWAVLRTSKGIDLSRVARQVGRPAKSKATKTNRRA